MDFLEKLRSKAVLVDRALENYLPSQRKYPVIIYEAMRYSVFAGGKRLRPALVMAAAEAVGGEASRVLNVACALELIHTYSLIHDDLPAMDNDDFRRGKPTCHRVYGEAMAILAGDALLTLAFELMAKSVPEADPGVFLRVIAEIAGAAGTQGMIGGQVVDILLEDRRPKECEVSGSIYHDADRDTKKDIEIDVLEYMHTHKTGALYRAAVRSGAMLAGAGKEKLKALTVYAECLGLAFQIKDDILDIEGDEKKLGKPVGSDKKNKKATYPALLGMEKAKQKAGQAVEAALNALESFDSRADFLRELAAFTINRDF